MVPANWHTHILHNSWAALISLAASFIFIWDHKKDSLRAVTIYFNKRISIRKHAEYVYSIIKHLLKSIYNKVHAQGLI